MGGRIEVTSELGEGTVFTVYLDWEKVDAKQVKQEAEEKNKRVAGNIEHLQGKTILLCEDHPINAEITKKLLEKVGCKVVVAKDGKQGVEDFSGSALHEFMAVLMDIRMPVMDGIEAAKENKNLTESGCRCHSYYCFIGQCL
jgi:response regulator RpfG family c-di-GMP phosphodiesterase